MRDARDETLMMRYGSGDMKAFEILYDRYRGSLYRYFLRQTSDPATANDLYQGAWEKVIGARERYSESSPFRAWLFRIAHNHLVDHYRARRPSQPIDEDLADETVTQPTAEIEAGERRERLLQALQKLPEEQREAIVLKLEAGLGVEEIGRITGAGFETAKSRLRYATRKLKQALQT